MTRCSLRSLPGSGEDQWCPGRIKRTRPARITLCIRFLLFIAFLSFVVFCAGPFLFYGPLKFTTNINRPVVFIWHGVCALSPRNQRHYLKNFPMVFRNADSEMGNRRWSWLDPCRDRRSSVCRERLLQMLERETFRKPLLSPGPPKNGIPRREDFPGCRDVRKPECRT